MFRSIHKFHIWFFYLTIAFIIIIAPVSIKCAPPFQLSRVVDIIRIPDIKMSFDDLPWWDICVQSIFVLVRPFNETNANGVTRPSRWNVHMRGGDKNILLLWPQTYSRPINVNTSPSCAYHNQKCQEQPLSISTLAQAACGSSSTYKSRGGENVRENKKGRPEGVVL